MTSDQQKQQLLTKFSPLALEEICWSKSKARTGKLDELYPEEMAAVYLMFFPAPKSATQLYQEQQILQFLKSQRSIILKDAQYIGLYDPQNWTPFNKFMLELSPLKKPLNNYQFDEFDALKRQFKSLRSKYDQRAQVPGTKEWHHKHKLPMPSKN
ncbi:hypothetical protein [Epilithonimonas mollis]|uniref:Uncharacterized protein n=1 Tax=Epilithonimonas mollis TaxID=216903 RepID=A0A1M6UJV4_9FLAO|nr:hypothetical protein [Epilithonimonas mollis]SHK69423.1 hypothetical protein SAMN05444371_3333 [Epilithonimonas mollis]